MQTVSHGVTIVPESIIREILAGDALGISAAAKLFPAHKGQSPTTNPATVWRWLTVGARSASGIVVKLDAARVGGRWLTSRAAIERFVTALTDNTTSPTPIPQPSRSDSQRRRAISAANAKLAAAGA